jgi:hypothetical protein
MNSAPLPAENGEPATSDNTPVLLMAKADTVPEPELLTKAKAVVCPEVMGQFPILLHPENMITLKISNAERSASRTRRGRARELCAGEIIGGISTHAMKIISSSGHLHLPRT